MSIREVIHDTEKYRVAGRKFPAGPSLLIGLNGGLPHRNLHIELAYGEVVVWDQYGEVRTVIESQKP